MVCLLDLTVQIAVRIYAFLSVFQRMLRQCLLTGAERESAVVSHLGGVLCVCQNDAIYLVIKTEGKRGLLLRDLTVLFVNTFHTFLPLLVLQILEVLRIFRPEIRCV